MLSHRRTVLVIVLVLVMLRPLTGSAPRDAGPAVRLDVVAGGDQSAVINSAFTDLITIRAADSTGQPVPGVPVTFAPPTSGASTVVDALTVVTDASGSATISAAANGVAGVYYVGVEAPAAAGGIPPLTAVRLSNLATAPSVVQNAGTTLTLQAPVNSDYPAVRVRVRNAANAAMPNVAVDFTGPAAGPGFAEMVTADFFDVFPIAGGGRVYTDSLGVAGVILLANTTPGSYVVSARVAGVATTVDFVLTNTARVPASIRANDSPLLSGNAVRPGERFDDLAFRVLDSVGDPAPNVGVTLAAPPAGPTVSLDGLSYVTDADGWIHAGGQANSIEGVYSITAVADGIATPATMLMQNRPDGYLVGERLADAAGLDDAGNPRSLRGFLDDGSYLLLDVCAGWCSVCRLAQPQALDAKSALATTGVSLKVVPLLVDGNTVNTPSTQADAAAWRAQYGLLDPVLHASGAIATPFWNAGWFVGGVDNPVYPTYLLVAPDGTILARHPQIFASSAEMIAFVTAHVPASITVADVSVSEGGGSALVTVTRNRTGVDATVSFTTAGGTAGPDDFTPVSGVISLTGSQTTATITVPIANDALDEPAETVGVDLSNAIGAAIVRGHGTVTIVDDDAPSAISIGDARTVEGTGTNPVVLVPVRLDRPSGFTIAVSYTMRAGTATGKDAAFASGSVTFAPGQTLRTLPVVIAGDSAAEAKETFDIVLGGATNATVANGVGTVTIVDDDYDTTPPSVAPKADVVVDVKMTPTAAVIVFYTPPGAKDAADGTLTPACLPSPGSLFRLGRTTVTCVAEDWAGNVGSNTFGVVVRLPIVLGAVFDWRAPAGPALTAVHRLQLVLVRVNAGAYRPGAIVRLSFIDADGVRQTIGAGVARLDGSFEALAVIPLRAASGPGQVLADSAGATGEYDRAWLLTVQ